MMRSGFISLSCRGTMRQIRAFLAFSLVLFGQTKPGAPLQSLSDKHDSEHDVLRGSPGLFRINTTHAPLPKYPEPTRKAGRQGLVVIELVVGPDGMVKEHLIHESFDADAARSVEETLKTWRWHSIEEMKRHKVIEDCEKCLRIGRLEFRFEIRDGKAVVIDLADEENRRLNRPKLF